MKKFNVVFGTGVCIFCVLIILTNLVLYQRLNIKQNDSYKVFINRIEQEIEAFEDNKKTMVTNIQELNIEDITEVQEKFGIDVLALETMNLHTNGSEELAEWIGNGTQDYHLFSTKNNIYKITYQRQNAYTSDVLWAFNGISLVLIMILAAVFLYIRNNILKPFFEFSEFPYELAKGNLTKPLKENRNRYFGRFLWGMDLLREHLEQSKEKELELQKEKKMLLLSLSHDIKTPLNAISLYAKAISRNLYKDEEKKIEVAENIHAKVGEIEGYMAEIIKASNEEFLNFEVQNGEFYIGDAISYIEEYYEDKMRINQIDFSIEKYANCLLFGDRERLIEVLQNLIENAIKYGDGKKIRIEAKKQEEAFEIIVRNTGCTLSDAELNHIFDSFYRGSNVGNQKGSGLGLFICRKLMHLMEGEILADIISEENEKIMQIKVVLTVIRN